MQRIITVCKSGIILFVTLVEDVLASELSPALNLDIGERSEKAIDRSPQLRSTVATATLFLDHPRVSTKQFSLHQPRLVASFNVRFSDLSSTLVHLAHRPVRHCYET